uniref:Spindle pole body component n=1 Tax=Spongospora subterranea TaxID=70186 RepID=A0A0H5QNF7_9EUKA|eukprot:CRZ03117.1 hypothetical protein [Spongospora subterranea]
MEKIAANLIECVGGDRNTVASFTELLKPCTAFNKVEAFNIRHARKKVGRKAADLSQFKERIDQIDKLTDCPVNVDQFLHVLGHIIDDPSTRSIICSVASSKRKETMANASISTSSRRLSSSFSTSMNTTAMFDALPVQPTTPHKTTPSVSMHRSLPTMPSKSSTIAETKSLPVQSISDRNTQVGLSFSETISLRSYRGYYGAVCDLDFNATWPIPVPLSVVNASNRRCRGSINYGDVVLFTNGSLYLGAEGSGNISMINAVADSRIKWTVLPAGSALDESRIHVNDRVVLKSCFATLLYCNPDGSVNCNCSDTSFPGVTWTISKSSIPFAPKWLDDLYDISMFSFSKDGGRFSNVTDKREQELAFARAVRSCLLGIPSDLIRLASSGGSGTPPSFVLSVMENLPVTLKFQAERFLPTANCYLTVKSEIQRRSRYEFGFVSQALAASIEQVLETYMIKVTQLEKEPLQTLWFHLQDEIYKIKLLHKLVEGVINASGGLLLHEVYKLYCSQGDGVSRQLFHKLMSDVATPYFKMLSQWIHFGVVEDPYEEFQISVRHDLTKDNLEKEFNDAFWDDRYVIRSEMVPSFLSQFSSQILLTGKYLNVLRQCSLKRCLNISKKSGANPSSFCFDAPQNGKIIEAAFRIASADLLDVLLTENHLPDHLRCIYRYFLHGQGDFFVNFLDSAEAELSRPSSAQSLNRLQSLLDLAFSSIPDNPLHDRIHCRLEQYTLVQKMNVIHTLARETLVGGAHPGIDGFTAKASFTGIEAFTLDYNVSWPLSLILSKKALTKYQLIFRHLFYIKHVDRQVGITWKYQQRLRELSLSSTFSLSLALRLRMMHFLQNLQFYLTIEVLEPNYRKLEQALLADDVNTVDRVIEAHDQFLDTCLKECLLTNHNILQSLTSLLSSCLIFARNMNNYHASFELLELTQNATPISGSKRRKRLAMLSSQVMAAGQNSDYVEMIAKFLEKFDQKLTGLIEQLTERANTLHESHMMNLCTRLDYNSYYHDRRHANNPS